MRDAETGSDPGEGQHLRSGAARAAVTLGLVVGACAAAVDAEGPRVQGCYVVVPNDEIHCPFHPIDPRHTVVYLDGTSGATRAADVGRPEMPRGDLVLDPFFELGWGPGVASVSPDRERILVARSQSDCPPWTGAPGPGLDCSYGRATLWIAQHVEHAPEDPSDDEWVHINLTRRLLGRNSEIHGWTTWLHRDLALFNAVVFPDDGGWYAGRQELNSAQIYALRFGRPGEVTIEPFAPTQLWRPRCLTGRVHAQPSSGGSCFAGQRISMVRRCYDEPQRPEAWAWWNTRNFDGTGPRCVPDAPLLVPVLRTYVVELDASCRPTRGFEELVPVHEPRAEPVFRQMGRVPESGDMLSGISPDGRFVAFATNRGDPDGDPTDNCAGFRLNLADTSDAMSGMATRWTHVCPLGPDLRCAGEPLRVSSVRSPPESTPLPSFVMLPGRSGPPLPAVVYSRSWGVLGQSRVNEVVRWDFLSGPGAHLTPAFGGNADAIMPIPAPPVTRP